MPLNRLFDVIERTRDTAQWRAVFGVPQEVEGRTIIPVAQVSYAFGLGFGRDAEPRPEDEDQAGGGGGAMARPLGAIVVDAGGVRFEETVDVGAISLAGIALGALVVTQVAATVRAFLRRK